ADAQRNHILHLRHNLKKVANAGARQVNDVFGNVTSCVHSVQSPKPKVAYGATFSRLFSSAGTSSKNPCSLYERNRKCVAVESTPSMVESFSETNAATFCRLEPLTN